MSSSNICNNVESESANAVIFLLSLNDSLLLPYVSSASNLSIIEFRILLKETLMKEIPGKLLYSCRLYHIFWTIIPPIILLIGSIGNVLACIVLCYYLINKCSSYIYLAVMVIVDEIILLTGLLRRYLGYIFVRHIENESVVFCRLTQFIGVSSSLISVWLIVVMTIERVIIIYLPLRAKQITQKKIARGVISSTIIFSSIVASHFFFTVDTHLTKQHVNKTNHIQSGECTVKPQFHHFYRIWTILDASLYSFIPFGVLISLNVLIVREILRTKNNRTFLVSNYNQTCSKSMKKVSTDTHHLSVTLILVSIMFLITTTPLVVLKLFIYFRDKEEVYQTGIVQLLDVVFEMLMYTNHSINFLLYCATGNRFRQHVFSLLLCRDLSLNRPNENTKYARSTIQMSEMDAMLRGKRYTVFQEE